ncbi:hypothetical protein NLJ89_g10888 [Agrocybe chaxingu]|uniref:Uncharacterized protein n=1 Tax=Agrocybe chaxingu TaxID=84603 RepID=A0A9W8MNH8_9AGAR|nr:hypothetical protein NLJ89_g10888 [Agrocybe chaxingu]
MVVNRKQPAAPALASRSSSSQPIPTKKQPKPPPPSSTSNANSTNTRKAAPLPAKQKPPAPNQQKPVVQTPAEVFLRPALPPLTRPFHRLFLLHMSTNPIFNSPPLYTPEPALCTSLSNYRTYFLEPYVLPPLKHTLTFTQTVSEPYVASAQTHLEPYLAPVQRVITTTKPYVVRTYTTARDLWQKKLVPLYTDTLKPYYESAVVPRYVRYVQPRLEPLQKKASAYFAHYVSKPVSKQYATLNLKGHELYVRHVLPYVRVVQPHARRIVETTSTYVVGLYQAYNEHVHPIVKDAWVAARPLLCTAWKHSKAFAIQATDIGGALIKRGLTELGVARRAYVDPHVSKIWDKVAEGNASVETKEAPAVEDLPDIQTAESIPEPTHVVSAESSSRPAPVQITVESKQEPPAVVEPEPPVPTPEEIVEAPTKNVKRTKAGLERSHLRRAPRTLRLLL